MDRKPLSALSWVIISILFSALLFAFFLVGDHGFLDVRRQRTRLASLQREVTHLAAENTALEKQVAALKSDPKAVEKLAREELQLVKPDDVVLVLPQGWEARVKKSAAPPAPPQPK